MAAAGSCTGSGCKCDGSCGQGDENAAAIISYEETSTAAPSCDGSTCHGANCPSEHCSNGACPGVTCYGNCTQGGACQAGTCHGCKQFSIGLGFGTGSGLHLIGPIVWFNKGTEPRCATSEVTNQIADSEDGHDFEASNMVPPAPADPTPAEPATGHSFVLTTDGNGHLLMNTTPGTVSGNMIFIGGPPQLSCPQLNFQLENAPIAKTGFIFQATSPEETSPADHSGASCTDGCPLAITGLDEVPLTPAAPCCCEEPSDGTQTPAEPPALLTLSQHKDPATGLPSAPAWQDELLKAFRGRRLSELFEAHSAPAPGCHELGRLVAEFPKHEDLEVAHTGVGSGRSLTIVDTPHFVRIFESGPTSGPDHFFTTTKATTTSSTTCPNCREEFRVFLEEIFRGNEATDAIAQAAHHEGDVKATEAGRDLPHVTHSKIAAVTISYPLKDLVLCDDAGRPVFDTCTIIDHLQSAVAPESWSHPSVSIQLDQQSVSLVVTQTAEVHQKISDHLRYLRRLQVKQICNLIEKLSGDVDENSEPTPTTDAITPTADVELGPALPVGK